LLVVDTGGWYNLCCPSSGVDQSIAPGGIYRLTSATTRQSRPAEQRRDWNVLTAEEASQLVQDSQQALSDRQQALWQLCRLNNTQSHAGLIAALKSPEPALRHIAAHSISVQRVADSATALQQALSGEKDPQVLRALAEAIGRLGTTEAIPALLEALAKVSDDRMLEHSLLYAMMELDHPESLVNSLQSTKPEQRRAAMIVIDQSGRSDLLSPSEVLKGLSSPHAGLRQTAVDILTRHPDWAAEHRQTFIDGWRKALTDAELRPSFAAVLAAWGESPEIAQAFGKQLASIASQTPAEHALLIESLSGFQNRVLPHAWTPGLLALLKNGDAAARASLAEWLAGMKIEAADAPSLREAILAQVTQEKDVATQLHWLAALPAGSQLPDSDLEELVVGGLLGEKGAASVAAAAQALDRVVLSHTAAQRLIAGLDRVAPLQLMPAISSLSALKQDDLDAQLLERLETLPAARTLPLEQVTSLYRNRSQSLRTTAKQVVETLGKPPADVEAKLDALLGQLKSGDAARGFQVFRSTKAACSACHRIGYVGGQVGPELTHIGRTRTRRALLEAIFFPSARLEQSYTPLRVLTADGQVLNGLVARDSGDSLELITGPNQRVTIAREDIEQSLPSPVSIMPAGLEQQLSLEELADLLTLLESTK
ncbi:MAG: HEAT repeat domain-containing protein, partial [Aureliella sp.]